MPYCFRYFLGFLFFLGLLPGGSLSAQPAEPPAVRTMTRVQANQILLRWEPSTEPLWMAGIQGGYYVERKIVFRDNAPVAGSAFTRLTAQPIRPAGVAGWTPYLLPDSVQHQVLYRLVTGQDTVAVGADSINRIRVESDADRRFFFGLLAASQSYSAARLAALGYIDPTLQSNERYVYRVVLANPPAGLTVQYAETNPIGLADYTPLPAPMKPKLTFERYYASLKWLHNTLQSPPYVSYWIERSVDGTHFNRVNDRPFVLLNDSTNLYAYKDPLPKGRKTYYYRVVGKTPFDELNGSGVAVGQSKDTLVFAPRIKTLRLQSDSRVYMSWQFPGDTTLSQPGPAGADTLLRGYFISVAPSPTAKFIPVRYNLNPRDTAAYIDNYSGKVPGGSTLYFTVGAVLQDGDTLLSASVFVEPLDTIPPAAPMGLKGRIDANGQVYLSWQPNEESDLLGYKVFRSQRRGEEASAVSDTTILLRSEFSESIVLNNLNPALYYQVKALDTHYNTSGPSLPLQVMKPDVVGPTAPLFLSDSLQNGQLVLIWAPSSSPDVVRQLLLRRESDNAPWQSIAALSAGERSYADRNVQPARGYRYLLLAQDGAGLLSDSSALRRIEVPASQGAGHPLLAAFNAQPDAGLPGVRLNWSYDGSSVSEYQIYRSVDTKPFGLWRMVAGLEQGTEDEEAISAGTYRYKIQAVFKDGSVSNWQSASATVSASATASPGEAPYVQSSLAGQQATVGQPFTYTLPPGVFTDPTGGVITLTILSQGLPDGLTATGQTLNGIPHQAGIFTVTVQGRQASGYLLSTPLSLTVNQPPVAVAAIPNLTVTVGQSFSYALPIWVFADAGGPAPQVTILPAGLPGGVTTNGSVLGGTVSGPGPYTLTAQAQDSQGGIATISWLLIGNQPPLVQTPLASISLLTGQAVTWTLPAVTFRDPDGQLTDVRIRATGLPPGLAVRQNQLIGVPTTAGIYTLTAIATDDGGASTQTTTQVQVGQPTNQLPVVTGTNPTVQGLVGDSLTYTLPEGLFFDPDGRITQLTLTGSLPNGLVRTGVTLQGTPTQAGSFSLTATASDDRGSSVSTPIELIVAGLPAPAAPTLTGSSTVCSGNATLLTAVGCTGLITWSHGATGATVQVSPVATTAYSATCSSGGQAVVAANNVTVTVLSLPAAPQIGSLTICQGGSAPLSAANCSGSLVWSTGVTAPSIMVNPAVTTVYSATCQAGTCTSLPGSATVFVGNTPVASIASNPGLTLCAGQSTTLTVSGGSAYQWSTGASTASLSISATGTYSVTVTTGTGCSAVASADVLVNPLPMSTLTANPGLTICAGQSTSLTAGGGSTYRWNTGVTTAVISVSASGPFSVTVTNDNGCSAVTSASVESTSLTAPGVSASSGTITVGQSVTLTATGCSGTVNWFRSTTAIGTGSLLILSPTASSTYTATCSLNSCTSGLSAPVGVIVNPAPPTLTASSLTLCAGQSTTLTAGGCSGTVTWTGGSAGTTLVVSPTSSKTYTATCTVNGQTSASATPIQITVNATPVATVAASPGLTICSGQSTTLTASGGSSYRWSTGATTASISVSTAGAYSVTVTNGAGCSTVNNVSVVSAGPQIVSVPPNQTVTYGSNVTLTVNATGTNLQYAWYRNGTTASYQMVETAGSQTGTNTASLTLYSVRNTSPISYYLRVQSGASCVTFVGPISVRSTIR